MPCAEPQRLLVASVIVDVSTRALDKAFCYAVPGALSSVRVGCAVAVEFGNRPVVAYVVRLETLSDAETAKRHGVGAAKLKSVLGILSEPFFDSVSAELVFWVAREYACPLADALHLFTPPGGSPKMKRVEGSWQLVHPGVGPVDDRWVELTESGRAYVPPRNATRQRRVMEALSSGGMRVAELACELDAPGAVLTALERKGVVCIQARRRMRTPAVVETTPPERAIATLTPGQGEALEAVDGACASAMPGGPLRCVVLDGVTGSGKTEVYLRAIAHVLARGKGAIVLVPEIALTPQTVGRFRARFGEDVVVLHSRLSPGERLDQWDLVRQGAVHVVVGTRSALCAPLADVGLIVIDEEHEDTYKQESSPRYHARTLAMRMCELRGAALVLGSATPSIDTLASTQVAGDRPASVHVVLSQRPNAHPLPPVELVDMTREFSHGSRSMFSASLLDALESTLARDEKAVLLLNKRGFATFVLCRECGFVPECPNCAVSLTYHEQGTRLVCHHCGHSRAVPARCPKCGSPYLRKFGTGTQRVESELAGVLGPHARIVRMDADTVKGKGAHERLLSQFADTPGSVLLGTQMIAKGLDFPDVTLVGVINADTTLKLPDFRAAERTYQLLEQVSGRAGRADKPGRVVVQSYLPQHPAIQAVAHHDRSLFLPAELAEREELGYPPYARLANVLVWGKDERAVKQRAVELALALDSAIASAGSEWVMLGPSACLLSKLRGLYRWHILVKAPPRADLSALIAPLLARTSRHDGGVRAAVDIDPVNLF